jgi:hypothetical protein
VILEHNLTGGTSPLIEVPTTGACTCSAPSSTDVPFPTCGDYVRVTICVRMTEMTPNLLSIFGFDITDRIVQRTTTYRYETTETPDGSACTTCPNS